LPAFPGNCHQPTSARSRRPLPTGSERPVATAEQTRDEIPQHPEGPAYDIATAKDMHGDLCITLDCATIEPAVSLLRGAFAVINIAVYH